MFINDSQNCLDIFFDLSVSESQYLQIACFQIFISFVIIFHLVRVATAVHLYNKASFMAKEIYDISPNYLLTAEMPTGQPVCTQLPP